MEKIVLWVQNVLLPTLGPAGLFVVAFFDSSFLSLPEINDILVVTSCSLDPRSAWIPITMATLGSLAGCSVLWEIGRRGGEPLLERRFGKAQVARTRTAFERWDLLALIVPALLPPPCRSKSSSSPRACSGCPGAGSRAPSSPLAACPTLSGG